MSDVIKLIGGFGPFNPEQPENGELTLKELKRRTKYIQDNYENLECCWGYPVYYQTFAKYRQLSVEYFPKFDKSDKFGLFMIWLTNGPSIFEYTETRFPILALLIIKLICLLYDK